MTGFPAAQLGWIADQIWGEPPDPHPVAVLGRLVNRAELALYRPTRSRGVAVALGAVATSSLAALGVTLAGGPLGAAAVVWTCVAGRSLWQHAARMQALLEADDLEAAREFVPALVGRDPSGLDRAELARATVESVAESTVDAIVAPLFWTAVAGAPGAAAYRAVNTLDSMLGYRDDRYGAFGWASARLDDAAGFVPARFTALAVAALRPGRPVLATVRADAPGHPSPNAGVAEAAFAAALGLRLGGTNRYGDRVEVRAPLGDGRPPAPADIGRACRLSRQVATLAVALAW